MTTLERFDKWKNPTRPADDKIRVWQHQTSFFIIVQSNKIHVYQITWYKVEQQLYNRMISQFSIYTLILGIFDWNPLHIIRNNRPSSGYKHWQRDLSYNQFSPTLPDGRCLNLHKLFDESLYSLQAVGRMCVVWRHFEFQYWQELYCKYKLIGTLLCFLQMNRVFFLKMKVWTESGQPIRQFLFVRHFFKTITWSAWPFHMHVISSRPFNNIQICKII